MTGKSVPGGNCIKGDRGFNKIMCYGLKPNRDSKFVSIGGKKGWVCGSSS